MAAAPLPAEMIGAEIAGPEVVRTVEALRARVAEWRRAGRSVGLVPTMGALHDGHLALLRAALAECDRAVVTIFVNPAQFAPTEDFASYPRGEGRDLALIAATGGHLAFVPDVAEMYPEGFATRVAVGGGLTEGLCGAARPHFFGGVATVVTKLLLQALPDRAYFGEKDYQQLLVVKRLAQDLDIPVAIRGVPTVREADGLAMSSRNAYLSAEQRAVAPALHRVLRDVARRVAAGEDCAEAAEAGRAALRAAGFDRIDYLEVRDAATLEPVTRLDREGGARPARVFAAAFLGETRLIDNVGVGQEPW